MSRFSPRLEVLSAGQRSLWNEFGSVPDYFTLYGDTATALRLGHHAADRFEFETAWDFKAEHVRKEIPWLKGARILSEAHNELVASIEREGEKIQVSFTGGRDIGRVAEPDQCLTNEVKVASLLDLAATKVIEFRDHSESHDYIDLIYMMGAGLLLQVILGAAAAVSHCQLSPEEELEHLRSFETDDETKRLLAQEASQIRKVPNVPLQCEVITPWLDSQVTVNGESQKDVFRDTVTEFIPEAGTAPRMFHSEVRTSRGPETEAWKGLSDVPPHFVLYGTAALAVRNEGYFHDGLLLITSENFEPKELFAHISLFKESTFVRTIESSPNHLQVIVGYGDNKVSVRFEGAKEFGQLAAPDRCAENGVAVASLADLGAWTLIESQCNIPHHLGIRDFGHLRELVEAGPRLDVLLAGAFALAPSTFSQQESLEQLRDLGSGRSLSVWPDEHAIAKLANQIETIPPVRLQSAELGVEPINTSLLRDVDRDVTSQFVNSIGPSGGSAMIQPHVEAATYIERDVWSQLSDVPSHFVLYGQPAVGMRLGMSWGEDFLFRSAEPFEPELLREQIKCLCEENSLKHLVTVRESSPNHLSVLIGEGLDSVSLRFEGAVESGQLAPPSRCADNNVAVASLADLGAWTLVEFRDSLPNAGGHQAEALAKILENGPKLEALLAGARALVPDRCFVETMLQDLRSLDRPEINHTGIELSAIDRQIAEAARSVTAVPPIAIQSAEIGAAAAVPQQQAQMQAAMEAER